MSGSGSNSSNRGTYLTLPPRSKNVAGNRTMEAWNWCFQEQKEGEM